MQASKPLKPMALDPSVRSMRLGDQLYELILARIVKGEFVEGERLPSEIRLCEEFGVSRPVVREALSRLQADGLVVSRVMRRPSEEMISIAPAGSIAELMRCFEFRIALEGETAALAALRRTSDDLRQIDAAMQALDTVIAQGEVGTGPDVDLHMAIARATRNKLFEISLKSIFAQLEGGMQLARSLSLRRSRVRLETVQEEHSAVVEAIRAEDAEAARAAMRAHINNARTRILTDSLEP
jgi:GntR family transcriptional regulator, transcriptional repressor for pyruvate dehydrogenase complex